MHLHLKIKLFNLLRNWATSLIIHKIQHPPNVNNAFPSIPSNIKSDINFVNDSNLQ